LYYCKSEHTSCSGSHPCFFIDPKTLRGKESKSLVENTWHIEAARVQQSRQQRRSGSVPKTEEKLQVKAA
jgi:hypothetical protein